MKRFLIAFGAACILGLSITGIVFIVHAQQEQAATRHLINAGPDNLAREEIAARQEGIPLTAQELQQPLPPANQNAAPLYTKLTKLLHDKPLGLPKYAEGMDAFHSYTPAQIATVRQTLAARQDVMTLVHQAADKPRCVFVRDWSKGPKLALPEYMYMREAARLIETESYLRARDGYFQEAITNQTRGLHIAGHAASDHLLLAYLVGVASESLTLKGMQSIMVIAGPNAGVAKAVRQAINTEHSRLSLRNAMAGETGFDCATFSHMHEAEKNGVDAVIAAGGFPDGVTRQVRASKVTQQRLHALIDAWEAEYLARMRPLVAASDQPPLVRRAAFAAVEQSVGNDNVLTSFFADDLVPVFSVIDQNDTRTSARVTVTLAAAAIFDEKAKTGTYPETLPQPFSDPFADKPLGYRCEGASGFVVYSAGPTGTFDGGKAGEKAPPQESVFRYPATPIPLSADVLK